MNAFLWERRPRRDSALQTTDLASRARRPQKRRCLLCWSGFQAAQAGMPENRGFQEVRNALD
jgi:hypothetical protein